MTEIINKVLWVAVAILLVCFLVHKAEIKDLNEDLDTLKANIIKQNNAIEMMKVESGLQKHKLLMAQKSGAKESKLYNAKADKLLAKKVSPNCEQAIQWGALQGSRIYDCWKTGCNR